MTHTESFQPESPLAIAAGLQRDWLDNLFYHQAKIPTNATTFDWYMALAFAIRDRLLQRWLSTRETYLHSASKLVCYLSAEFLIGPQLGQNLLNLGLEQAAERAAQDLGLNLAAIRAAEPEPGLGNGGLGRLAACYLDSLSTVEVPAIGYGIRYEFGIFEQYICDGWQREVTDKWLQFGNPWEVPRPELAVEVKLGGRTEHWSDPDGRFGVRWVSDTIVKGVPYDIPILGYRVNTANTLRLWKAEAHQTFDFQAFNQGDYYGAVDQKITSENITKVLYPNDATLAGKRLRLEQQYFFVSCALQDLLNRHQRLGLELDTLADHHAIQLNDTHPAIGVAELMRLLVDEHRLEWERAWRITTASFGYTNHTLLPEALETWPLPIFRQVLPRHLEIIFEINRRFLDQVRMSYPGDQDRLERMSLIDERGDRAVRMAHLAAVGSRAINGVADLHTRLLRTSVLKDFHDLWPERFHNVTNGVSPRRWLAIANRHLRQLLVETIGDGWIRDLQQLERLEVLADDPQFQARWREVRGNAKRDLATYIHEQLGVLVDPGSMFDVMVKRIHEYKRQQLSVLHAITLYERLKRDPDLDMVPRTLIFAGKAAPGYVMAKLTIKLINAVAAMVNQDPAVAARLRVVFLPDFNVRLGQRIYPAADLSEQISLAGKEASGTGNMKFALSGAVTIGTLDGANIEIRERVGDDNFFRFGMTTEEVGQLQRDGYRPWELLERDEELRQALELIACGHFSSGDHELFRPLVDLLRGQDPYCVLADYRAYVDCQEQVSEAFRNPGAWTRMSILNSARCGYFSSDRAVAEYCDQIWQAQPQTVQLLVAGLPG